MTATTAADYLKYSSAKLRHSTDWALDAIGGGLCDHDTGHDIELEAVHVAIAEVAKLAELFGDPNRYSDGRLVKTGTWIEDGVYTDNVWHPDPSQEKPRSWRSNLIHDPGTPCPGIYEVTTDPATQQIHVRVIRLAEHAVDSQHHDGDDTGEPW